MPLDWTKYRNEFPVTDRFAYFQHAAVTALPTRCREAIEEFLTDQVQNGCLNGGKWRQRVRNIRENIADLLNVQPERVGFVKNTSHGLSVVAESLPLNSGDRVAVPEGEFPANVYPWKNLARKDVGLQRISMDRGAVRLDDIKNTVTPDTKVLTLSSVQFNSGFRADLKTIGRFCQKEDIWFVVDGIQSIGWDPLDLFELEVDAIVADAHKWLCGPEGIGICYLSKDFQEFLEVSNVGWNSVQEAYDFGSDDFLLKTSASVLEEGSYNHVGLMGLGASVELIQEIGLENIKKRNMKLKKQLSDLLHNMEFHLVHDQWDSQYESPIVVAHHANWDESDLISELHDRGVQVSHRGGGLRLGVHFFNNSQDLEQFRDALIQVVQ